MTSPFKKTIDNVGTINHSAENLKPENAAVLWTSTLGKLYTVRYGKTYIFGSNQSSLLLSCVFLKKCSTMVS